MIGCKIATTMAFGIALKNQSAKNRKINVNCMMKNGKAKIASAVNRIAKKINPPNKAPNSNGNNKLKPRTNSGNTKMLNSNVAPKINAALNCQNKFSGSNKM